LSILIKNGIIVTVNENDQIIKNGALYVENDRIVDLGRTRDITKKHRADKVIDARKKLVMPGLINAHTHMVDSLARGLGADMALLDWLKDFLWPFFAEVTEDDAYAGALLGCLEAIKSGCTFVAENYYPPRERKHNIDRIAEAIDESGIRGTLIRGYHDRKGMVPEVFIEDDDEVVREYDRLIRTWHKKANGRIMTWVSPVNLPFSSLESIVKLHELAEKYEVGLHTHLSESKGEVELIRKEYGKDYVEVFNDLGVLGPKFQGAHAVWVSDKEIALLAKTNSRVIHNPTSNMYLASGTAPVPQMLKAGVTVALGTDGPCCNNNLDMIQTLKFAALIHKSNSLIPTVITANEVVRMATIEGARSFGLENEIGSLEVGKKADITIIDLWRPHILPVFDPIATLVYSANGGDVDTVIVDGKIVMEDREVKTIDEQLTLKKAKEAAEDLVQRTPKLTKLRKISSL
jgi:5-methylthioadenosine/S-adenosylhomocysteine deaminase